MPIETEDKCPFGDATRKIPPVRADQPPLVCDAGGVWHAHGFGEVRAVLRSTDVEQDGWQKRTMARTPLRTLPMLYLEGDDHRRMRRMTARFFAASTVQNEYRAMMEAAADEIVADFRGTGRADLGELTTRMAARVMTRIMGLTNSLRPGMAQRIRGFFDRASIPGLTLRPRVLLSFLQAQYYLLSFVLLDVWPAVRARRREAATGGASEGAPPEPKDIISFLIANDYGNAEIFSECFMYAAAGITTTREFISMAAWHFLEHPDARRHYLASDDATRERILHEILRLEPVATHLYRRALTDITLGSDGETTTIPAGARIVLHLQAANDDAAVVGADGACLRPERRVGAPAQPYVLSFGDGHHKCSGLSLSIQETDIFLRRLLALDGLRVVAPPEIGAKEITQGYVLRDFAIAVGP